MDFWKAKLAAFLHDPPEKCLDIAGHEMMAKSHFNSVGLTAEDLKKIEHVMNLADHFAAAADRFVFPKIKCAATFTGEAQSEDGGAFVHPLCSTHYETGELKSVEQYSTVLSSALGGVKTDEPKAAFFHVWRRWREYATTTENGKYSEIALFPADTRIPDHTIWNHNTAASALAGCYYDGRLHPAMLMFQLGPVQDFIAQARSTRDLWSGSYLLSWLIAHAMKAISDEIGPDAIIFPNLRGNGIFDALHREQYYKDLWKNGDKGSDTTWERMKKDKKDHLAQWLMTPTLPNRFLALVPENRAEELAKKAEEAIRLELKTIGATVWKWIEAENAKRGQDSENTSSWKERFDRQIDAFPQMSWAVQPWLDGDECLKQFKQLPINKGRKADDITPWKRLNDMLTLSQEWLPQEDRDSRFYSDIEKTKLNNPGILWEAHYALVDAKLAARRNTRDFMVWEDKNGEGTVKDSLSGKEEVIGSEAFWKFLVKEHDEKHDKLFTAGNHRYGAMNLIKRLWCIPEIGYLRVLLGMTDDAYRKASSFESIPDIAKNNQYGGKYVAVLAMDGDEMGKWVSGEKTPKFIDQISNRARKYLTSLQHKEEIEKMHRLLTPSYHQQLSEALSNFAIWLAQVIVENFSGELIYAGGDDVLAILPSDRAIACAVALKDVFCGKYPEGKFLQDVAIQQDGFANAGADYPLILPGTACTVSVGLAIGHQNAPLQMLVKEAQNAEHRAKNDYGRDGIAFSVYKRSGEIIQWGCKWDSAALPLMSLLTTLKLKDDGSPRENDGLSSRFPYALSKLLEPYQLHKLDQDSLGKDALKKIVAQELEVVIRQQGRNLADDDKAVLEKQCDAWLDDCFDDALEKDAKKEKTADFIKPFLTETFITRGPGEDE